MLEVRRRNENQAKGQQKAACQVRGQARASRAACCHTQAPELWPAGLSAGSLHGAVDLAKWLALAMGLEGRDIPCGYWCDNLHQSKPNHLKSVLKGLCTCLGGLPLSRGRAGLPHRLSRGKGEGAAAEASAVLRPRLGVASAEVCGSSWSRGESTFKRKGNESTPWWRSGPIQKHTRRTTQLPLDISANTTPRSSNY